MDKKSLTGQGMRELIADFRVMDRLVCGLSKEQTSKGTDFMKEVRKHGIDIHATNTDRHNQSKVEGVIREMCKKWFRVMLRKNIPHRLWDYRLKWVSEIMQRNACSEGSLHYFTSPEEVTGETTDISEYLDFGFYD